MNNCQKSISPCLSIIMKIVSFCRDFAIPMFMLLNMPSVVWGWISTCWIGSTKERFLRRNAIQDLSYAQRAYDQFVTDLTNSATTRACIFATLHVPATLLLMERLEASGLSGFVGKVNMDRNASEKLTEKSAGESLLDTWNWLDRALCYRNIKPILTPRFVPSCTDELLDGLGEIRKQYGYPCKAIFRKI